MKKYYLYVVLTRTNTVVSKLIHFVSKDDYTHAVLALDKDLTYMYSFSRRYTHNPFIGRVRRENFSEGVYNFQKVLPGVVIELEVSKEQYDTAISLLNNFIKSPNIYKYNYKGLLNSWLSRERCYENRFLCSEFVYYILNASGIADFNISRNLVKPQNLLNLNGKVIFKGDLKEYAHPAEDIYLE